jgi:hypothetical protein
MVWMRIVARGEISPERNWREKAPAIERPLQQVSRVLVAMGRLFVIFPVNDRYPRRYLNGSVILYAHHRDIKAT